MKTYRDIGQKAPALCVDCGKKPKITPLYGAQLDRCHDCHVEHERQVAMAHRAMGQRGYTQH